MVRVRSGGGRSELEASSPGQTGLEWLCSVCDCTSITSRHRTEGASDLGDLGDYKIYRAVWFSGTLVARTASSWSWLKRFFALIRSQSPFALERSKPSTGSVQSVSKPISGSVEQLKSVADNGEQREVLQSDQSSVHSFARSSLLHTSEQSTEMRPSALSLAAQVRVPMIKFLGARLPRPHFDPASLPPIPTSSAAASFTAPNPGLSSSPPVGKIPRGQCIEEWQLPLRFRRQPISEEECAAINNGGAYGLE